MTNERFPIVTDYLDEIKYHSTARLIWDAMTPEAQSQAIDSGALTPNQIDLVLKRLTINTFLDFLDPTK